MEIIEFQVSCIIFWGVLYQSRSYNRRGPEHIFGVEGIFWGVLYQLKGPTMEGGPEQGTSRPMKLRHLAILNLN